MTKDEIKAEAEKRIDDFLQGRGDKFLREGWIKWYVEGKITGVNNTVDEAIKQIEQLYKLDAEHMKKHVLSILSTLKIK